VDSCKYLEKIKMRNRGRKGKGNMEAIGKYLPSLLFSSLLWKGKGKYIWWNIQERSTSFPPSL